METGICVVMKIYCSVTLLFFIDVWLIYNVVLVSGVQPNDSVIHIHISLLFQILSPCRLLQSTE